MSHDFSAVKQDLREKIAAFQTVLDLLEEYYPDPQQENEQRAETKRIPEETIAQAKRTKHRKRETIAGVLDSKACNKCGQVKPLEEFPKHPQCKGGHSGACKTCTNQRGRENYARKESSGKAKATESRVDEKPHKCEDCGKAFRTRYMLQEHRKLKHGELVS